MDVFKKPCDRRLLRGGLIAAGVSLAALLSTCGGESEDSARASLETNWAYKPDSDLVFDGRIIHQGGQWALNCYAEELRTVAAEPGDTLLSLAHRAGTELRQAPSLRGTDVPADVFAVPLAEINGLDNPDLIQAGQDYDFPDYCRLG